MDILSPTSKAERNDPTRRMARALALANVATYAEGHRLPPLGNPGWLALARFLIALGTVPPTAEQLDKGVPK